MSNQIWDLSHIQPSTAHACWPGRRFRRCSGTRRQEARPAGLDAPEAPGHLAQLDLERNRHRGARDRRRPDGAGLPAAANVPPSCPTPSSNGCWPTWPSCAPAACPTASTRPTRPSQVHYLCEDSRTTVLFVEDDEQLDKALEVRDSLPLLRKIVVFDMEGLRNLDDPGVISLDALRALGRDYNAAHPDELQQRSDAVKPEDLAILVYTSGTTGKSKGAMHLHSGLVYTMRGYNSLITQNEDDERMCFLPLCHIAERMGGEYHALYTGAKLNFVENPETIPENVREIAPTVFVAVPRVWEKFYSGVLIALKEASRLQQMVYGWAIGVGTQIADRVLAQQAGQRLAQAAVPRGRLAGAEQRAQDDRHPPLARAVHRRGADLGRPDPLVPGAGRADARGLGHDRDLWRLQRRAGQPHEARQHRPGGSVQRDEDRPGHRRDPGARQERVRRLPEPAREDRRDHRPRRLDAHRRRRHHGRRRLLHDHRPDEGHHHHRRRQERDAQRTRERPEVLALHHRRGGDRRQAALPDGRSS